MTRRFPKCLKRMVGERGFEPPTPGPETKEISQGVDFSIHVSGASTAQTHVILIHRSQSFSYGCPRMGAPNQGLSAPFRDITVEGYVESNVGSGTFVSKILPERMLHVASESDEKPRLQRKHPLGISDYARRAKMFSGYENRPIRAFRANLPALDLFPTHLWTRITLRCLRKMSTRNLMGCDPLGNVPLRQALAEYLSRSRGVRCMPDQIAIVSGVQEAIDLAARLLLSPFDRVCIEDPGYPGVVSAFRAHGAKIQPVSGELIRWR
jgi:DNA-binding transcriptional MocR family regulator